MVQGTGCHKRVEEKEVLLLQKGRVVARLVVKPLVEVEWMKPR